jgi:LPS-assembly protein
MQSQLKLVIIAAVLCHLFQVMPLVISQARAQTSPAPELTSKMQISATEGEPLTITADRQEQQGNISTLTGNVELHFRGYVLAADTITYDKATGNVTAEGHVSLDGGLHDVHITASHGTYNIQTRTGKFYDVKGTTGERFKGKNVTLTSTSPVAFSGKVVEQTGEDEYVIHHGTITTCELPHPKWTFSAARMVIEVGNSAHIYHTIFWLKGIPVIYLPFAAPPVEKVGRQSGFMLPIFGTSSTKGTVLGDSFYWAINRSMDTTVGGEYLSKRGWLLHDVFRARPTESSFVNFDYFGVKDRLGQGGEDIKFSGDTLLPYDFRGVASLNYLSSFVFRLAFAETFSQAVNSEVKSVAFTSRTFDGFSINAFASRYQNFQSTAPGDVVTIFHAPGIEVSSVDQRLGSSSFFWSYDAAAEGLRRTEPGFDTPNLVGRFDGEPDISLPLFIDGWTVRPEVALRDTLYTESLVPGAPATAGTAIQQEADRRSVETGIEVRPPTLGRVFERPVAGRKVKHTIEPYVIYRYTNGVNNFPSIIRFDYRDILSDTNEVEYGLTQRLYLKHIHENCNPGKAPENRTTNDEDDSDKSNFTNCTPAGANEFVSWELKQKYFLDPNFGGAVVTGVRNVLATTADFAGIAFLTDPRRFAPIISTLRMRSTANTDMQWELDYDTKKGRINASTFFTTFHFGDFFLGGSHAYFQVLPDEILLTNAAAGAATPAGFNQFNQFRVLGGYGNPSKRGLSAAENVGFDSTLSFIQYAATQAAYNWDCCGISLEYRRFALGQVRGENAFRFAFTLANIGTFGNIKRQERLF